MLFATHEAARLLRPAVSAHRTCLYMVPPAPIFHCFTQTIVQLYTLVGNHSLFPYHYSPLQYPRDGLSSSKRGTWRKGEIDANELIDSKISAHLDPAIDHHHGLLKAELIQKGQFIQHRVEKSQGRELLPQCQNRGQVKDDEGRQACLRPQGQDGASRRFSERRG